MSLNEKETFAKAIIIPGLHWFVGDECSVFTDTELTGSAFPGAVNLRYMAQPMILIHNNEWIAGLLPRHVSEDTAKSFQVIVRAALASPGHALECALSVPVSRRSFLSKASDAFSWCAGFIPRGSPCHMIRAPSLAGLYRSIWPRFKLPHVNLAADLLRHVIKDMLESIARSWRDTDRTFYHHYYDVWQESYFDARMAETLWHFNCSEWLMEALAYWTRTAPEECFSASLADKIGALSVWHERMIPKLTMLAGEQREDGSWALRTPANRIEYDRDKPALGQTAGYLEDFLSFSTTNGDKRFDDVIERAIAYIREWGERPEGAQIWEFHYKTPDLLCASRLSRCFQKAYLWSKRAEYLELAVEWAYKGLPFVYLWQPPGVDSALFHAIPCFGVTRASDPYGKWVGFSSREVFSWRGVSCPWIGLDFAETILRLTQMCPDPILDHVAEGIVATALNTRNLCPLEFRIIPDAYRLDIRQVPYPMWVIPRNLVEICMLLLEKKGEPFSTRSARPRLDRTIACVKTQEESKPSVALPIHAYVDLTGRCNIRCIICPHSYETFPVHQHPLMSDQVIRRVQESILPNAKAITFSASGESLLHPRCLELIREASRYRFLPEIIDNGTLLDRKTLETMIEAGVYLRVSFDGASEAVFEKIRVGASHARVLSSIRQAVALQRQIRNERFCLRFDTTVHRDNIHELPQIIELASNCGVEQVFVHHLYTDQIPLKDHSLDLFPDISDQQMMNSLRTAVDRGIFLALPPLFTNRSDFQEEYKNLIGRLVVNRMIPFVTPSFGPDVRYICRVPWSEVLIKPDGNVSPCCLLQEEYHLGNLEHQEFEEIWFGEQYDSIRNSVNSLRPPRICHPAQCKIRRIHLDGGRILDQSGNLILTSFYPGSLRYQMDLVRSEIMSDNRAIRLVLALTNTGDTIWYCVDSQPGSEVIGRVNIGIQLYDVNGLQIKHDFLRVALPRNIHPGIGMTFPVEIPLTDETIGHRLKIDLVDEGIAWFSDLENEPVFYNL